MKKNQLLSALLFCSIGAFAQNVTIGEREFAAHPSAILEIQSTDKGVLIPRLTLEQRNKVLVNSASVGLLIYQIDNTPGFYFYDGAAWKFLSNPPSQLEDLAKVATTGDYDDLINKPELFSGNYADLTGIPAVFDSNYFALKNLPNIRDSIIMYGFDGDYQSLSNRPNFHAVAISGNYADLENKPELFSGDYADLIGIPAVFDSNYFALKNLPNIRDSIIVYGFDGDYQNLSNTPNFHAVAISGNYDDLLNKPAIPSTPEDISAAPASHSHTIANVVGLQEVLDGKANTSHGNHVPTPQTLNNTVFLRNDNTWQAVTPANIGAVANNDHRLSNARPADGGHAESANYASEAKWAYYADEAKWAESADESKWADYAESANFASLAERVKFPLIIQEVGSSGRTSNYDGSIARTIEILGQESGTWTPIAVNGTIAHFENCRWHRVGNRMYISGRIRFSNSSNNIIQSVSGLPRMPKHNTEIISGNIFLLHIEEDGRPLHGISNNGYMYVTNFGNGILHVQGIGNSFTEFVINGSYEI